MNEKPFQPKVFLVGAGPGDPDLITLKAVKVLEASEVVLYDELVNEEILKHCNQNAQLMFVGKYKGRHSLEQEFLNDLLYTLSLQYKVIVRLKGGDPMIFGRGGEEYSFLKANNIDCEVIPGITAASGVAASIGLPLTHRDCSSELVFHTGHRKKGFEGTNFSSLNFKQKTHIIYMGLSRLMEIVDEIKSGENDNSNLPIAIVEKGTQKDQKIFFGTISTIEEVTENEIISSPALIILGEVVRFLDDKAPVKLRERVHSRSI